MTIRARGAETDIELPDSPADLSARGWKEVGTQLWREISEDHVSVVAAGIAFYALIALFPAIAALVGISGVILDPADLGGELTRIVAYLPPSAAEIVSDQVVSVTGSSGAGSGLVAISGLVIAIYGAMKGTLTLIEGLNIAYDETERRGILRLYLTALGLTLAILFGCLLTLGLAVILPSILGLLPFGNLAETVIPWVSWLILATFTMLGLAVIYRFGPSREPPRWRWISPGAALATLIWIGGTAAFSLYVQRLGSYAETYGALGGVIVLLTWLWLSAFSVLAGAELNAELERQAGRSADHLQTGAALGPSLAPQPAEAALSPEPAHMRLALSAAPSDKTRKLSPLLLLAGLVIWQALRREDPRIPPKT
ncbi:YihY/virulence factor BrkB family protein [Paracoccus litorisediminis]|uniref:YihY family inner membrane protein n=1 Tax=Paracoccus litorisediminis TaxID=2006130 RepID=A0A844HPT1_9RHOB|nr:YihY/virulence factor BrkB family protein [Paracoccus litorisediminis]MTH61856.1 YihY family inner membrane protein [Paracoccus litorisediminis]